jgi:TRAP-type C4-dicarboxylate transport system substrate-binding protein
MAWTSVNPMRDRRSTGLLAARTLLVAISLACPGNSRSRAEDRPGTVLIRIDAYGPKTAEAVAQEKRVNELLAQATQGRLQVIRYYRPFPHRFSRQYVHSFVHAAMMEETHGRHLIDAAFVSSDAVSEVVPECAVLTAPMLITNWRQLDAVRAALTPELDRRLYESGSKLIGWWDYGQVHLFSTSRIASVDDLQRARPWDYMENRSLNEFYGMLSSGAVPMPIDGLHDAQAEHTIDAVWTSAALGRDMLWLENARFVSSEPITMVQGAFLLKRDVWDALSGHDQKAFQETLERALDEQRRRARREDDFAYHGLLANGVEWVDLEEPERWRSLARRVGQRIRDRAPQLYGQVVAILGSSSFSEDGTTERPAAAQK